MNDRKICFISCVKNHLRFEESVRYIHTLELPAGFEVEILPVVDAPSIAAGYNYAMKASDAKYKVYLHDDVRIINKRFIMDILVLFERHTEVGLLGLLGAQKLPTHAIWWESEELFGKVFDNYTGNMELVSFQEVVEEYQSVEAIDGRLMVTQYDLPWNEELFDGWDFYETSQSTAFIRQGMKVGVPRQETPWAMQECGNKESEHLFYYRNLYLRHYRQEEKHKALPLVSILIPTYNRPHLFELALRSALQQTYLNIEIIVCDDSTNDDTKQVMEKYVKLFDNIRYVKNERNLGQFQNDLKLFELANGEYINFLMDDDVFHHEKIEKMMNYFIADQDKEITLVTSHRLMIDEEGKRYPEEGITRRLFEEDVILDGKVFGEFLLQFNANFIGEPTTALFRKTDLTVPFGTFCGREYGCNVDIATWLNLLAKGKIVYISETLSYFRIHSGQQLQSHKMLAAGSADYMHEVLYAPQYGFFQDHSKYLSALKGAKKYVDSIMRGIGNLEETGYSSEIDGLYRMLTETIQSLETIQQNDISELPLASILIPAYNRPHYLELALQSALNQTYKNIEIIICDDSTNDEVQEMLQPFLDKFKNIRYFKNEKNLHADNPRKCLSLAKGEYVNFLMDDDLFHPDKIERMMAYFLESPDISLVTSYRQPIDETGNNLKAFGALAKVFDEVVILSGKDMGNMLLANCINFIGEPTTVLFKKSALHEDFGYFNSRDYGCINDVATWVTLLSNGNGVYIPEALSYFRIHPGQNQGKPEVLKHSILDWYNLIVDARSKGFLSNQNDYKLALKNSLKQGISIVETSMSQNLSEVMKNREVMDTLHKTISELFSFEKE